MRLARVVVVVVVLYCLAMMPLNVVVFSTQQQATCAAAGASFDSSIDRALEKAVLRAEATVPYVGLVRTMQSHRQ